MTLDKVTGVWMSLDLIVTNFFETCTATCLPRAVARSPQLTPSMLPRRESAQTSRTERRRLKRRPRAHTRKRQGSNLQWALPQLDARSVCRFSIPSRRLFPSLAQLQKKLSQLITQDFTMESAKVPVKLVKVTRVLGRTGTST